jgi:hypothetical protein
MRVTSGTYVRDCNDIETLRALCGTTRTGLELALQSAVKTESITLTSAICKLALSCEWVYRDLCLYTHRVSRIRAGLPRNLCSIADRSRGFSVVATSKVSLGPIQPYV